MHTHIYYIFHTHPLNMCAYSVFPPCGTQNWLWSLMHAKWRHTIELQSQLHTHTCFLNALLPYTWFQLAFPCRKEETLLVKSAGLPVIVWPFCLHLPSIEIFDVYHCAQFIPGLGWNLGHGDRLSWWAHLLLLLLHWWKQRSEICSRLVAASFQVGAGKYLAFRCLIAYCTFSF